jgi:dCTP deaminase
LSIIGRRQLIQRIRDGDLAVTPLLSPNQIGTSSIDLRMGNVALMARARGSSHVDPALAKSEKQQSPYVAEMRRQQKHERYELPFGAELLLHPGSLALVPTLEWVRLPQDLMGVVTARSTWAREGLSIATATLIEPGYEGIVTLELANLGQIPIALYPGLKIAQIAFSEVVDDGARADKAQFKGSFSPWQGILAKDDELDFLPDKLATLARSDEYQAGVAGEEEI